MDLFCNGYWFSPSSIGCGTTFQDYKWFSSDNGTVLVSASGAVKAKRPGQVIIRVVSVFDSMNYDEVYTSFY